MQVRILGCGPSFGVPSLNRGFGKCDPMNPKNFRLRSSLLIREEGTNVLIDSGPDVRLQLLRAGHPKLDAVLYTHDHYDHMGGADDLRLALGENRETLPVYLSDRDTTHFKNILDYMFKPDHQGHTVFDLHTIYPYTPFTINGMKVIPIPQQHGKGESFGYRIGDFAYSTDVVDMDPAGFDVLAGVKVWIVGVVTSVPNIKHLHTEKALEWIERIKPERAFFTHMGTRMDYDALCAYLPPHIRPVYDGMEIEI